MKGAIVGMDPFNPLASVVVFQYNPATLSRSLTPQVTGGDGAKGEPLRFTGPPKEAIKVDVEIDATDQLETASFPETSMGIGPHLAALEMLLYPKSAYVIGTEVLLAAGVIEIIPPEASLTVFAWGVSRVVPVKLTDLSITEEAFDPNLNPIQAKVGLGLQVLNYNDLGLKTVGGALFMVHQTAKEVMATLSSGENAGEAVAGLV